MTTQDKPYPASTVVLLNITTKWPHKVLLIKRSKNAIFLPGAYVFPGGRIEAQDEIFGKLLLKDLDNIKRIQRFFNVDIGMIARHIAAAIRETLEETGLSILSLSKDKKSHVNNTELMRLLERPDVENLCPCLDNIWPISWWITPPGETRRFDTWFFLAILDNSSGCNDLDAHLSEEATLRVWLSPDEALKAYEQQRIFLAPPTRAILERMVSTKNMPEFLGVVDEPLFPIKPLFVDEAGKKMLVLPGDPLHKEQTKPLMLIKTRYTFP